MAEAEDHKNMYKNAGKGEQEGNRRRRTEATIQLRREKRGNELNKRRNIDENAEYESEVSDYEKDKQFQCTFAEARNILMSNPSIADLRNVFGYIRKQLSRAQNVPVNEIVQEGLVQALVQGLSVDDTKVQYECAWALTNVVSGDSDHTQIAVKCGATQAFIKAAYTADAALAEQCFWGLANIIGDCAELRDHAIECGFLDIFCNYVGTKLGEIKTSFVRTLAWVCTNLCRHKSPQLNEQQIIILLPLIKEFVQFNDNTTKQDACWALSYLSDSSDEILDLVFKTNILPSIRYLLGSTVPEMLAPAVRVYGNFTSGSDKHTQAIIDTGILNREVPAILNSAGVKIIKETVWMLSNILAGTPAQIQAVINAGLFPSILQFLRRGDFKVSVECMWAISNLCHSENHQQCYYLATIKVFDFVFPISWMNGCHVDFITHMLSVIRSVFNAIANIHPDELEGYKQSFEEIGGIDAIEELQNHENAEIYEACYELIQTYFYDDEEEENVTPAASKADAVEMNHPVFKF
jgi:hypothetical protein